MYQNIFSFFIVIFLITGCADTGDNAAVSSTTTTLTSSPSRLKADGVSISTITLQVKDDNSINFTKSAGSVELINSGSAIVSSVTDNLDGSYTATISNTIAESVIISATVRGEAMVDTATVDFYLDLVLNNYECISMVTSEGAIELALDIINAPISVANFLSYANASFYDGTIFHRVIDGFVVQGGGFDGTFNQKTTNVPIINEADNGLLNIRGTIAMARTPDPQSATSQFFINTVNNQSLDHTAKTTDGWGYAVFGQVLTGMDVVDGISKVATGATGQFASDVPLENIVIQSVDVINCNTVTQ